MSTTASDVPDSGQLPGRYEFAVETTRGEPPTDPDWQLFSDVIRSFEAEPGASVGRQDAVGTPDAVDHNRGMEEPSLSVGYDLQRFPVNVNFEDPKITSVGGTTLGVKSTDAGDTGLDVTIYNNDESVSETITTDGTDGTTFVPGSTSFETIGRVTVSAAPTGSIEVYEDSGGSAGTLFGETGSGNTDVDDLTPQDASGYGLLRDRYNRLPGTLTVVARRTHPGGNDNAGVREYTVVRGAAAESVEPTLDPSAENPILMETSWQPVKVRSVKIHQLSSGETLSVSSTESTADSGISVTIEADDGTSETISMGSSGSTTFGGGGGKDIDAIWLDDNPEGDVTVTSDSSSTTVAQLEGGLTYSDDDQPVDGDRGVPLTGTGSHASSNGTSYEHFVGDRFERPAGSAVRPRVNSAGWSVENDINTSMLHTTRAPAVDEGNRTVSVEADVGGKFVTHDAMMESLQKVQNTLEHELSGGIIVFPNTTPTDSPADTREADQAVASLSETFSASGEPAINFKSI